MARSRILDWLAARARTGPPGKLSDFVVGAWRGWAGHLLAAIWRPRMEGWEHLPADRPFLLVSNHSGGGGLEVCALLMLWCRRFGGERRITGMAHPVFFSVPGVASLLRQVGAVPSTYDAPLAALAQGVPVLVFPGGDVDAFRPIWRARRVDWNGRQGFLRIARRAWVPIVPLGITGSHYTLPILWRSRLLPWLLVIPALIGLKRFPLTLPALLVASLLLALVGPTHGWPLAGGLAWLSLSSPLAMLPVVPWPIRARLGPPLEPEALFGTKDEAAPLEPAYDRVVREVEALLACRPAAPPAG